MQEANYYAINSIEGPSAMITTPKGDIARGVLGRLFAEQIAPPDYFPLVDRGQETEISITAMDTSTLELLGTAIPLETPVLRSLWNMLNAVRYRGRVRVPEISIILGFAWTPILIPGGSGI